MSNSDIIVVKPYLNAAAAPKGKNRNYWFRKEKSSRNALLPPHVMDNLKTAVINCVEYDSLSPEHEREMFQVGFRHFRSRIHSPNGFFSEFNSVFLFALQVRVSINKLCPVFYSISLILDRFPAINGPWADLVRDLRNRINTTEGFEGYLDWGKARGKDFLALARIVYLAVKGTTRANEPSSARVEAFLHSTEGNPSELRSAMVSTMDIFCRIAQNPDLGVPLTVDLSPLEFVMAGYLIYLLRTKLTDEQLSNYIARMRGRAKEACGEDMKFNTDNFKSILAFIRDECNKLKKFGRGKRVVAADKPFERVESEVDRFSYNAPLDEDKDEELEKGTVDQRPSEKRKRTTDNQSEDSDTEYLPAKRVKQKKATPQLQTSGNTVGLTSSVSTLKVGAGADYSPARTTIRRPGIIPSASRSCGAPAPRVQIARTDSQTAKPSVPPSAALRSSPASTSQGPSTPETQRRNARPVTEGLPTPMSTPTTDVVVSGRRSTPSVDSFSLSRDSHAESGSGSIYSRLKFSKMFTGPAEGQSTGHQAQQPAIPLPYSPIDHETMQKIGCLTLTNVTAAGPPSVNPPMRISITPTASLSPPQMFMPNPAGAIVEKSQDPRLTAKSKATVAGKGMSNAADTANTGTGGAGNRRLNTPTKRSSTDHFSSQGFYLHSSEDGSKGGGQ